MENICRKIIVNDIYQSCMVNNIAYYCRRVDESIHQNFINATSSSFSSLLVCHVRFFLVLPNLFAFKGDDFITITLHRLHYSRKVRTGSCLKYAERIKRYVVLLKYIASHFQTILMFFLLHMNFLFHVAKFWNHS